VWIQRAYWHIGFDETLFGLGRSIVTMVHHVEII
jgi:hypothetical protein